ncbi:MAG: Wzz/FepE/Etk N-terminal domain-containing protein, partial [Clostridia bacterium]|nr:Wzz/FepE/Etk N-terminal domain-containing protein [Clostridia bacterium]
MDNNNIATAGNEVKTVENKEYELDLIQLFSVVARKLWILVLVGLLAAVGAYFHTVKNIAPIYVSTSRVYIISRQSSFSASLNDFNTADSVKVDFKVLINSNEIFREVLRNVGEDPANYRSLRGKVSLD